MPVDDIMRELKNRPAKQAGEGAQPQPPSRSAQAKLFAAQAGAYARQGSTYVWAKARQWPKTAAVIAIVVLGGVYWLTRSDTSTQTQARIVTIEKGDVDNTVTAVGSLQPSTYVDVGAQVSGQLKKLHVAIGDKVKKGDLLAEIDASVQTTKVEADQASLANLQAQLLDKQAQFALAQAQADRQTRLKADNATSASDYDSAIQTLKSSQASVAALRAQIQQSTATLQGDQTTLGYSKIYAPMDGTVVSQTSLEGQTLNANQQAPVILRIADLSTMTVQTQVSEADVSKLTPGMNAYFTTLGSNNRRWYGKLRQIQPTPTVTNNVVLYTALFDVQNEDGALLPQMTAQVFFIIAQAHDVIVAPLGALTFERQARSTNTSANAPAASANQNAQAAPNAQQSQQGNRQGRRNQRVTSGAPRAATVTLVKDNGDREEKHPVTVGVSDRVNAEILSGLKVGDKVVAGTIQPAASTNGGNGNNGNRQRNNGGPPGFGGFP